jgi:hypothetical protein
MGGLLFLGCLDDALEVLWRLGFLERCTLCVDACLVRCPGTPLAWSNAWAASNASGKLAEPWKMPNLVYRHTQDESVY